MCLTVADACQIWTGLTALLVMPHCEYRSLVVSDFCRPLPTLKTGIEHVLWIQLSTERIGRAVEVCGVESLIYKIQGAIYDL